MVDDLSRRLVPDELWALAEPLVPRFTPRPQGGGTAPVKDRAVFTAIVFVLTSGCAWRYLPPSFGVTVPTAHRRFTEWTKAGLWRKLHRAVLDELGSQRLIEWSRGWPTVPPSGPRGGTHDRPEPSRPRPTRTEDPRPVRRGRSAAVGVVSAAHTNDAAALKPLVLAIPAIRSRRGPRRRKPDKLHADTAYDQADLRTWLRDRGIAVRIARTGVESSTKLGKHRWVIERSIAWLFGYHRLAIRYERYANHFCAFLTLAAALTCDKKLAKSAT